jgi:hypothetical protein
MFEAPTDMAVTGERLGISLEATHELASLYANLESAIYDESGDFNDGVSLIRRTRATMGRMKRLISLLQDSLGDSVVTDEQVKEAFNVM